MSIEEIKDLIAQLKEALEWREMRTAYRLYEIICRELQKYGQAFFVQFIKAHLTDQEIAILCDYTYMQDYSRER